MTGMMPDSGVPFSDARNSLSDPDTIRCKELWYSTSRCQPRFDPAAANAVLSELINVVNCADLPYDCARLDNLCLAIKEMISKMAFAGTTLVFDDPGIYSWIVPPGVTRIYVRMWGGGGSGGGKLQVGGANAGEPNYRSTGHAGSGGGSGGYAEKVIKNLVPGTALRIEVGAGGASVTGDNFGNPGGLSSVARQTPLLVYCSATGGIGGDWGSGGPWFNNTHTDDPSNNRVAQVVLNPATGSGGDLNLGGGWGGKGDMAWITNIGGNGGQGGSAPGGGGSGGVGSTTFGYPGLEPGGGGAGAGGGTAQTTGSGKGADGWVILQWTDMSEL